MTPRPVFMRVTRPTLWNATRNVLAIGLINLSLKNWVRGRFAMWLVRLAWRIAP